jgi:hypothetical protein
MDTHGDARRRAAGAPAAAAGGLRLAVVGALVLLWPARAAAEPSEGFDVPVASDDYRVDYSLAVGLWRASQTSLQHRLRFQIPLWSAAVGAQFSVSHAVGDVDDTVAGNLRIYAHYFHTFEWARRASVTVGGGLDVYAPTATSLDPQSELAALVAGPAPGDASLDAPDIRFGVRPRIHLLGQAWIFTVQAHGAVAVHLLDDDVRAALEWGVHVSAAATTWISIVGEVSGVSWIDQAPSWSPQRNTSFGMGVRFTFPGGWLPGLFVRVPAAGNDTEAGEGIFVGVQLVWRHDRDWIRF